MAEHEPEAPVPCRRPFVVTECDQPYGHDGPHHAEVELPPHINEGLGQAWNDMERQARSARRWRWWFVVGAVANLVLYITQIIKGMTP